MNFTTRIMLVVWLGLFSLPSFAGMYCGSKLVMEGSSAEQAITLCGPPTFDNYSTIVYINKNGDGMNYYIHVNGAGMIDSITSNRGGKDD